MWTSSTNSTLELVEFARLSEAVFQVRKSGNRKEARKSEWKEGVNLGISFVLTQGMRRVRFYKKFTHEP